MNNIETILKFAMRMEKDAGDFYSYYMDKVTSSDTKELFQELIDTEKQHYEFIKKKFDEMGLKEPPISISWVVDDNFAAKDPHILANNTHFATEQGKDISDLAIIRMAYLIESDFATFYQSAANAVEGKTEKELLTTLAAWEVQHRDLFHTKYQSLLKKYWADTASIIFVD